MRPLPPVRSVGTIVTSSAETRNVFFFTIFLQAGLIKDSIMALLNIDKSPRTDIVTLEKEDFEKLVKPDEGLKTMISSLLNFLKGQAQGTPDRDPFWHSTDRPFPTVIDRDGEVLVKRHDPKKDPTQLYDALSANFPERSSWSLMGGLNLKEPREITNLFTRALTAEYKSFFNSDSGLKDWLSQVLNRDNIPNIPNFPNCADLLKLVQTWGEFRAGYPFKQFHYSWNGVESPKFEGTTTTSANWGISPTGKASWFVLGQERPKILVRKETKNVRLIQKDFENHFPQFLKTVSELRMNWLNMWGFNETFSNKARQLKYDPFVARGSIPQRLLALEELLKILQIQDLPEPAVTNNSSPQDALVVPVNTKNPGMDAFTTVEASTSARKILLDRLRIDLDAFGEAAIHAVTSYFKGGKNEKEVWNVIWKWTVEAGMGDVFHNIAEKESKTIIVYFNPSEKPKFYGDEKHEECIAICFDPKEAGVHPVTFKSKAEDPLNTLDALKSRGVRIPVFENAPRKPSVQTGLDPLRAWFNNLPERRSQNVPEGRKTTKPR